MPSVSLVWMLMCLPLLAARDDGSIVVSLHGSSRRGGNSKSAALKHVEFCLGCADPRAEGSHVWALAPRFGLHDFSVVGGVALAVPNDAATDLLNAVDLAGRVVLVERGRVSIMDKIVRAQAAGAVAVIVVDNGACDDEFADCGRSGGKEQGGFAYRDDPRAWEAVKVPAVLVTAANGERLQSLMDLQSVNVASLGAQLVARRQR
ncbi:unnamed protein product [Phaeothamnion confervicola]